MDLTVDDMDNLRHMLGVSLKTAGGKDVESMERLCRAGLAVKNGRYALSVDPCYHATQEGGRFVGLERLPK
jgi:hypothetical protein